MPPKRRPQRRESEPEPEPELEPEHNEGDEMIFDDEAFRRSYTDDTLIFYDDRRAEVRSRPGISIHLDNFDKKIDIRESELDEDRGRWALTKIEFYTDDETVQLQSKNATSLISIEKPSSYYDSIIKRISKYTFNIPCKEYPTNVLHPNYPLDTGIQVKDWMVFFIYHIFSVSSNLKLTFQYVNFGSVPEPEPEPEPESEKIPVPVPVPEPEPFSETGGESSDIIRVVLYRNSKFHGIEWEDSEGLVKIKNVTASKGEDYETFDHYNNEGLKPGQILTHIISRTPVLYTAVDAQHARDLLELLLYDGNVTLTLKKGSSEPESEIATPGDVVQDMDALIAFLKEKLGDDQPEAIVVPAPASDPATQVQPSAPLFVDNEIISIVERTHGPEYAGKIMDFFLKSNDGLGLNPYIERDVDALLFRIQRGAEDDLLSDLHLKKEDVEELIELISRRAGRLKHKKHKKSKKRKKSRKKKSKNRKTRKRKKSRKKEEKNKL